MLEARHLVKQYHGVCALNDVSFSLGPSDVLGYLGPNGSGKTTTIGILTGLIEPTRGQVLLDGVDIRPGGLLTLLGMVLAVVIGLIIPRAVRPFEGTLTFDEPADWAVNRLDLTA